MSSGYVTALVNGEAYAVGMAQSKNTKGGRGWKQGIDPRFIGRRIVEQREFAGLKQDQLAQKIGRHQSNLSAYETGATVPNLATLRLLAIHLSTSVDVLIGVDMVRAQLRASSEDTPVPPSNVVESRPPRAIKAGR